MIYIVCLIKILSTGNDDYHESNTNANSNFRVIKYNHLATLLHNTCLILHNFEIYL